MIKLSDKAIAAIKWLRDNLAKLAEVVADYPRLRNKIDEMRGGGDIRVDNPHNRPILISRQMQNAIRAAQDTRPKSQLFLVPCVTDGGTGTAPASFTYAFTVNGVSHTGVMPANTREQADLLAGSWGLWDAEQETFIILDETLDPGDCDDTETLPAGTPASSSDTGATGQVMWDSSYVYIAVGTNDWRRAALTTF